MKRSAAEMRLIRSATAYRRLANKLSVPARQRAIYRHNADRLTRQANEIRDRRAAAARPVV